MPLDRCRNHNVESFRRKLLCQCIAAVTERNPAFPIAASNDLPRLLNARNVIPVMEIAS